MLTSVSTKYAQKQPALKATRGESKYFRDLCIQLTDSDEDANAVKHAVMKSKLTMTHDTFVLLEKLEKIM